jgi:SAM-dependent methyltransferase
MQQPEYETMYHREEDYWWYVGLRDLVLAIIGQFSRERGGLTILDAGCGTGKLLEMCGEYMAYGLESSAEALRFVRLRALANVTRATICRMPYPDESFDLVVSADVICCIESPADVQALGEMRRVLKPGGILLMNLPAYECLKSHHDAAVHIKQRYTRDVLREMLWQVGLEHHTISYRNSLLLPVVALMRSTQKVLWSAPARPKSDLRRLPALLNRALVLPLLLENRLIQAGARLPFGLSVWCIATKL